MCGIIEVINYLPERLKNLFNNVEPNVLKEITEVRLKLMRPVTVTVKGKLYSVSISGNLCVPQNGCTIYKEDIDYTFGLLTRGSAYAYDEEIICGYITSSGGHRVGLSGTAILKNGTVVGMKNINGLYFRVAKEVFGCGDSVLSYVLKNGKPRNTLIASPPGKGKTTVLRDVARQLSISGYKVSVIDERYEICADRDGIPSFDLCNCDVLSGYPKSEGIERAVRTLSPDIVIFDEVGNTREGEALCSAVNCGVRFITSAHAYNIEELIKKNITGNLINQGSLDLLLIVNFGKVEDFCYLKERDKVENNGIEFDFSSLRNNGFEQTKEII